MASKRIPDIKSSLEFANDSWREIQRLISDAQEEDGKVKHIGHKAGVVLQATRQCFDYCAADIAEDFMPSFKGNTYYPFHPDSLGKGRPFHALSEDSPNIYAVLLRISENMRDRKQVDRTLALYSDVRAINDLVNANKHNSVTEIAEIPNSQTRVKFPNGGVITMSSPVSVGPEGVADMAKAKALDPTSWVTTPGVDLKAVKNFVFPDNYGLSRRDVGGFCMVAIVATRNILSEVYAAAYGTPSNMFDK